MLTSAAELIRGMASQLPLRTVLCDLDDCLYRVPEMPELVRENIQSERVCSLLHLMIIAGCFFKL